MPPIEVAQHPWWFWVTFNLFVLCMLALDLGVFHRKSHTVKYKEALAWTGVWMSLAFLFAGFIYWYEPSRAAAHQRSGEFIACYLIEQSLSVDNIFIFLLLFRYFKVSPEHQHRVLFYGILGAIVMRGILIFAGVALIHKFSWLNYFFGALLLYTGIKMARGGEPDVHPEHNPILRIFRRFVPITKDYHDHNFFFHSGGKLMATPLFAVLILVETTDLLFAADSIPAILAISNDSFILYTSNIFAVMGLRSLFFAVSGLMGLFHYLSYGLALILSFVGVKMVLDQGIGSFHLHVPILVSLGVIVGVLGLSIAASLMFPHQEKQES
ncbi:TerC family protein [soil metagenome]